VAGAGVGEGGRGESVVEDEDEYFGGQDREPVGVGRWWRHCEGGLAMGERSARGSSLVEGGSRSVIPVLTGVEVGID